MNKGVRILRQSQGSNESTSIQQQRNSTRQLAEDLGLDPDADLHTINLADHTGFSSLYKGSDADERIDTHPEIQSLLDDLRTGEYRYLIAHDDTRVARDAFYHVVEHAAVVGDCEIKFASDVPENRLTFVVSRAAATKAKYKEIQRAQRAVEERQENGFWQGEPPYGLKFDEKGEFLTIDPDEWPVVEEVFRLRSEGASYREIARETELSKSGVGKVVKKNRELYISRMSPEHPAVAD